MRFIIILFLCCGSFMTAFGQQICYDEQLREGDAFAAQTPPQLQEAINSWKSGLKYCRDLTTSQRTTLNNRIQNAEARLNPTPSVTTPVTTTPTRLSYEPETMFVEGGTFKMADNYTVTLSSYNIGKFEVTQKQWREVMGTEPSSFKNCDDCPVESVSWDDIQEYLTKLNAKAKKKYRLPTEAEWEFAARGGNNSKGFTFAGTSDETQLYRYANFCDKNCTYSWAEKSQNDGYVNTSPVGKFLPNELGLYDMSGNVWEWCADWYGDYSSGAVSNPTGAVKGTNRVFRGGSWYGNAAFCRTAFRFYSTPTGRGGNVGFRVVSTL